jgi:SRSO17 transposase
VPAGTAFATKPHLALAMIANAVAHGVRVEFVTGDEVYGADPLLRAGLRRLAIGHVLAIARNQPVQATEATAAVPRFGRRRLGRAGLGTPLLRYRLER